MKEGKAEYHKPSSTTDRQQIYKHTEMLNILKASISSSGHGEN